MTDMEKAIKMRGKRFKDKLDVFSFVFLLVFGVLMLMPLFYALWSSTLTKEEFNDALLFGVPHSGTQWLTNFSTAFTSNGVGTSMLLTLGRVVWYSFINTVTCTLAGYAFAKVRFKFKRATFLFMLSTMMIPAVALMVPSFVWMSHFPLVGGNNILGSGGSGFINNPAALFVPGWVSVYGIFLFRQCFVSVGGEFAEAAEIDGANFLSTIFRIYLPLIMPIIAVTVFNTYLGMWNDYMTSIIYLPNLPQWRLASTQAVTSMQAFSDPMMFGGPDYPKAFAIAVVMMAPSVILFCFVQKSFVEGLSMGAVKG